METSRFATLVKGLRVKNNNNSPKKQPRDFESVRPTSGTGSDRIFARTLTANVTGDVAAAALFEALFDNDRLVTGDKDGFWLTYNIRDMRHKTNLSTKEQAEARSILSDRQLVAFRVSFGGVGIEYLINHPLFQKQVFDQLAKGVR